MQNIAVVTGASSGIGRAIAVALAAAVILICLLTLVGFVTNTFLGDPSFNHTGMALHSAAGFIALGIGIVLLVRREEKLSWQLGTVPTLGFVAGLVLMLIGAGHAINSAQSMNAATSSVSPIERRNSKKRLTSDIGSSGRAMLLATGA